MKNKKEVKLTLTDTEQFLKILDPGAQHFHFQVFDDSGKSNVKPSTIIGTLKDKAKVLASKNDAGAGVFVAIQPHPKDKQRKTKFTSGVRTFLIDLDGAPLDSVLETLKEVGLAPNMVVNTSPGKYHVYLKVSDCPLDKYTAVQKALALKFGGDLHVNDLARVARVPGFNHNKDPKNPFMVGLHSVGDSEPYQFKTIIDRLGIQLVGNRKASREKNPSAVLSGDEILEGSRNKDLFTIGRKLRGLGVLESEIKNAMDTANLERCCPMLDQDELDKIFESVLSYKPDPEPFGVISEDGDGGISRVMRSSGFTGLMDGSSADIINKTLHTAVKLSAELKGSSQLLLQDEIKKKLKSMGISSPAAVVKQAFPPIKRDDQDDDDAVSEFLQETEPYEGEVNGSELLNEVESNISRYVVIDNDSLSAISLWIAHAWCLDAFSLSPFLRIISPVKGCGKTTLLTLISEMLPKCLLSANVTPASMFRLIDKFEASVGIDEADGAFKENYELLSLVNSSYTRSTSQVPRCASETNEIELFSVWGAKVICGIGKLPATTEDRSIVIQLKKKRPSEKMEKFRFDKLGAFGELKSKLKRFADDQTIELKDSPDPSLPVHLGDRPADNWRQLIMIAEIVGEGWPDRARNAAIALNSCQEDEEKLVYLLRDIRRVFNRLPDGTKAISSIKLTSQLVEIEGSPWSDLSGKHGDELTSTRLARLLAPLFIQTKRVRFEGVSLSGYALSSFEEPFERYLPLNSEGADLVEEELDIGVYHEDTSTDIGRDLFVPIG
jgi:hypothetical protein